MILSSQEHIDQYTQQGWWGTETLIDLFKRNVETAPDSIALADPPNRAELTMDDALRWTYTELAQAVDRLATALLHNDIVKDDVLMVQLPNIGELIIVYLAAARIGAIVSPLPVQYRTHELRLTMKLAEPKVFITTTNFNGFNYVEMVQSIAGEIPFLHTIIALGDQSPNGVLSLGEILNTVHDDATLRRYLSNTSWSANDIYTICWTSGTEAEPKGVPRSHNHWIAIAYGTTDGAELEPGDHLLNPFPMVNMSGIGGMLVPWLQTGGKLVMHHPLNLPAFLGQIKSESIHYTVAPPVLLNLLLLNKALLTQADLSSIKNIGSGSAPLSPWMVTQWKEQHGINVLNFFGANEGTAFVSSPHEVPDPAERALYFPRYGTAGFEWSNRVAEGMSARLIDPLTKQVVTEPDEPGEMALKGPTIFPGYYRRDDLTAKSFDDEGYFYTGDLFAIAGTGAELNRYRFVGRLKDLIIRGGMKIAPEEIESLVIEHPKVAEVAVVGIADKRLEDEERVCIVIAPKPEQEITLDEIHDFLKAKDIASYKMPKKLMLVEALPRNPVGKVLKRELRIKLEQSTQ